MNNREKMNNSIDKKILDLLKSSDKPLSTREISLKIKKAWHTVNAHCLRLQLEGKIKVIRAGNITLWSINHE